MNKINLEALCLAILCATIIAIAMSMGFLWGWYFGSL